MDEEKHYKNDELLQVDRIIFIASATSPLPHRLIEAAKETARIEEWYKQQYWIHEIDDIMDRLYCYDFIYCSLTSFFFIKKPMNLYRFKNINANSFYDTISINLTSGIQGSTDAA